MAIFDNYSPQNLRDGIQFELQKDNNISQATANALAKLKKDPHCYDMRKATSAEFVCPKCKSDKIQNGMDRNTGAMFQTCLSCRYKRNGKNSFDLVMPDGMEKARITKYPHLHTKKALAKTDKVIMIKQLNPETGLFEYRNVK